jgi:rRNA maturation protein Rpf1
VLLTTSRKPTRDMRTLCRDISYTFPDVVRVNRGKLSLEGIIEKKLEFNAEKVAIIERWMQGTGKIELFEVRQSSLVGVPPIIHVRNVKFRRDFRERVHKEKRIKSIAIASSSNENFDTKRLRNAFSSFFEIPIISLEEAISNKYDAIMQILIDSLNRIIITFKLVPDFVEIGPQLEVSPLCELKG